MAILLNSVYKPEVCSNNNYDSIFRNYLYSKMFNNLDSCIKEFIEKYKETMDNVLFGIFIFDFGKDGSYHVIIYDTEYFIIENDTTIGFYYNINDKIIILEAIKKHFDIEILYHESLINSIINEMIAEATEDITLKIRVNSSLGLTEFNTVIKTDLLYRLIDVVGENGFSGFSENIKFRTLEEMINYVYKKIGYLSNVSITYEFKGVKKYMDVFIN